MNGLPMLILATFPLVVTLVHGIGKKIPGAWNTIRIYNKKVPGAPHSPKKQPNSTINLYKPIQWWLPTFSHSSANLLAAKQSQTNPPTTAESHLPPECCLENGYYCSL